MISIQRAQNVTNAKKKPKMCMLEETKYCDDCCECFTCEIDSSKICNNCAECVKLTVFGSRLMRGLPQDIVRGYDFSSGKDNGDGSTR